MGRFANRRAAEQMERDGIKKLARWTKPKKVGCAWMQRPVILPKCGHSSCHKKAGYDTPLGFRCFDHAIEQASIAKATEAR